ncbi:hypothetical protein BDQ17DRAFT_1365066 [Cyathus striatus]|nr:hypothetical protein BDQ17DRAFT_1365066 [Cyathus striatus]
MHYFKTWLHVLRLYVALFMAVLFTTARHVGAQTFIDCNAMSTTVEMCTAPSFQGICVQVPMLSDVCCLSLVGGFVTLNKQISSVKVPGGVECTFFENFGCLSVVKNDTRVITGSFVNLASPAGSMGGFFPNLQVR